MSSVPPVRPQTGSATKDDKLWALLGHLSLLVGVGIIALAGVAVEIGVIMLVYLNNVLRQRMRDRIASSLLESQQPLSLSPMPRAGTTSRSTKAEAITR